MSRFSILHIIPGLVLLLFFSNCATGLPTQLPEWVREGGVNAALERLADPALRTKILVEINCYHPLQNILLVGYKNPDLRQYQGKLVLQNGEATGTFSGRYLKRENTK